MPTRRQCARLFAVVATALAFLAALPVLAGEPEGGESPSAAQKFRFQTDALDIFVSEPHDVGGLAFVVIERLPRHLPGGE